MDYVEMKWYSDIVDYTLQRIQPNIEMDHFTVLAWEQPEN